MFKFSIKGLLLLIAFVSLCFALVVSRMQLHEVEAELKSQRAKFHFLNVEDPKNIAAVELPSILGQDLWQWRVHLPSERQYCIRAAYKDLRPMRAPDGFEGDFSYDLKSGESIVSVLLDKVDRKWRLFVSSQSESELPSGNSDEIVCDTTQWIDDNSYGQMSAGNGKTEEDDPLKPFVLLHLRDSTPDANGKQVPWNTPTRGVLVWVEEAPKE